MMSIIQLMQLMQHGGNPTCGGYVGHAPVLLPDNSSHGLADTR